jgi:hypothetical protein
VAFFELFPFGKRCLRCLPDFRVDVTFPTGPPFHGSYCKGMSRLLIMTVAHQGVPDILNVRRQLLLNRDFLRGRMPETLMSYRGMVRSKLRSLRGFLHMPPVS